MPSLNSLNLYPLPSTAFLLSIPYVTQSAVGYNVFFPCGPDGGAENTGRVICIFVASIFMRRDFDGPSFPRPAFSVAVVPS